MQKWIDQANEYVSISDVLVSLNVFVPLTLDNKKVLCPFGFYHSDGGTAKAMRIYVSTNSAYCFSCSKSYRPVTLAAAAWGCSWQQAADRLLETAGYKPKTLKERWADATTPEVKEIDLISLSDALKMYCSAVSPDWRRQQYDAVVAAKLDVCLSLLPRIKTSADSVKWLEACKAAMRQVLS